MKRLTAESVRQYHQTGYLAPVRVLSTEETAALRSKLEAFEAGAGPLAGKLRQKSHLLFTWLNDLIRHERILDAVEDIIGPDILCWGTSFFIKEAHNPSFVSWRQDSTYWGLDPADIVTAWIALSDSTTENGAMRAACATPVPSATRDRSARAGPRRPRRPRAARSSARPIRERPRAPPHDSPLHPRGIRRPGRAAATRPRRHDALDGYHSGLPGETEDDFAQTLSLIAEVGFVSLFGFKYSPRPHTPALRLSDDVGESVKSERLARLFELSEAMGAAHLSSLVGTRQRVLVEGASKSEKGDLTQTPDQSCACATPENASSTIHR